MAIGKRVFGLSAMLLLSVVTATGGQPEERARPDRARPQRGGPPRAEGLFNRIDTDGNGSVTIEEFKKHHEERMRNRPKGPPEARGFGPQQGDRQRGRRRGGFQRQGPPQQGPPQRDGQGFGPPPRPRGEPGFGPRQRGPRNDQAGFGPPPRRGFSRGNQGPPCPHCQGSGQAPRGPRDRPETSAAEEGF